MEEIKPGYFAVIPASVRYSKDISNGSKLLYAEITCLSNQHGYCWASNLYFSKLYEVSTDTVSRWISELAKSGFILTIVDNAAGNSRKIWLSETQTIGKKQDTLSVKMPIGYPQKPVDPIRKNADIIVKENNKNKTTTGAKIDVAVFDSEVNALVIDSIPLEAEKENPTPVPPPPSPSPRPAPGESAPLRWDVFDIDTAAIELKENEFSAENFARITGTPKAQMFERFTAEVDVFVLEQKGKKTPYNRFDEFSSHFFNYERAKVRAGRPGASAQTSNRANLNSLGSNQAAYLEEPLF